MRKIGADIDGCIANFSGKFVELGNARYGTSFTELDQHDWDFKPWFSKTQVDEIWSKDILPTKNFWMTLRVLEGTNRLQSIARGDSSDRYEIYFITSRVPTAGMSPREQTCWWLRNHFGITYPNVIVVDNPHKKVAILQALEIGCMLDDKPSTIREMRDAGLRSYAKLSPYNCRESFGEGVVPVEFVDEYLEKELKIGN